ncbi:MAG: AAA family ATPase [Gammaproteobacteria bacterium]|nr:AAA family ATPase [Gammaproteobacteria bacterium]
MPDRNDLALVLRGGTPIVVVETHDEPGFLEMLRQICSGVTRDNYRPLFRWAVTEGLQRLDLALDAQTTTADPRDALRHIRAVDKPGVYALLDFHPYLNEPMHVRLLKDIALAARRRRQTLLLVSHALKLPPELERLAVRFELSLPGESERARIVQRIAEDWAQETGRGVDIDPQAFDLLVRNLAGLSTADTERLARNAITIDGAIGASDLPQVMQAKYELLNRDGVLSYEYDTARFADVGGLARFRTWLEQRRPAFLGEAGARGLEPPRGVLLVGVQGCGKSLAAKATAGLLGAPLLALDFGAIYDKYHGESERRLRESLRMAELMAPCVLWIDEIEKGLATGSGDSSGTSQRILGTFLTWLAERRSAVMVVATANDISALPPELIRKGRFDELFFVDLPSAQVRRDILDIHLRRRGLEPDHFDTARLAAACEGFSGAELEQAVVSALYAANALQQPLGPGHILAEMRRTRPLSVVMAERISALRAWARDRTVPAD